MYGKFQEHLQRELASIEEAGLFKRERIIAGPQGAEIQLQSGQEVLNFCANNYLGLSSHPRVLEAAHKTLETHGFGMSSVRFICGTQDIHKTLEKKLPVSWERRILYYMQLHLMPTAVFLNRCSAKKTPLFRMP